jgi:hypothetical protein
MKKYFLLLFILLTSTYLVYGQLPPAPIASPIQFGAYLPEIINPRDYANPETSGLMALDYNIFFNTKHYYDRNGNNADLLDLDLSGYMNALAIAYVSPEISFLGNARYIGFISPYYITSDFRIGLNSSEDTGQTANGTVNGFGDLGIAPLFLTWSLGEDKFDFTTGYMFTAPTGKYETGADDNIGLGYWTHDFQLFTYYYLRQKATALYWGNTFELHGKTKGVDVKAGSQYTIEYGVSHYLSEWFEVTIQGGNSWQSGEDSGDDVYWDSSYKDRNSSIGAGLGYWPVTGKLYTHLKWWTNYGMRQHFKVDYFQLQLIYLPGILQGKADKTPELTQ